MMKNLLFIMNNLNCGGAEKALISLLQIIDYSKYNIDLLLFKKEGMFLKQLPKEVNLIQEPEYYEYFTLPMKKAVKELIALRKLKIAMARILFGITLKREKNRMALEQRAWKYLSHAFFPMQKDYNTAIGFMEKNPIFFCVDKVRAKKKIGWIHTDYEKQGIDKKIDGKFFGDLDYIVGVSTGCVDVLRRQFPKEKNKFYVIHNIIQANTIRLLSEQETECGKIEGLNIVSVGRLTPAKGFDIAIRACLLLKNKGIKINWNIIGEGEERPRLEHMIQENGLQNNFYLLGAKENPYPYLRMADIYVQTSVYEGIGIAIAEAKVLKKPIIVTNFSTAKEQITNGLNGLIAEMTPESVAETIESLMSNKKIRDELVENLGKESPENMGEIMKLYKLIDNCEGEK